MIPPLDERGLLPAGVHDAALEEIPGIFCHNAHRVELWTCITERFLPVLKLELGSYSPTIPVLVFGGSFFSDKASPQDVEMTAVFDQTYGDACLWQAMQTFWGKHDMWKDQYRADYYPSLPGGSDFSQFFQYVGEKTAQAKGLSEKDYRGVLRIRQW
ncbi:DUF6932 family protein [Cupriavidus gilardii]|uniref:Uncharacterized protein n=1 Tax=Cupriavidus gilardii TaxID=82541 RepID=A0A849BL37_9BURK|nr:hypothetical protein [Cupriavidus gilardii]KAB0592791.1 hypothetical protein F7Q96_26005 [Cupriavidus gilardii]NNH14285.1 hypothetical protein [Cupriavidus gilardii]